MRAMAILSQLKTKKNPTTNNPKQKAFQHIQCSDKTVLVIVEKHSQYEDNYLLIFQVETLVSLKD